MYITYLLITLMAAAANGYAASMNFAGAESVKVVSDRLHMPRKWMIPFGVLLAAGSIGLLAGLAVPVLGTAAATGLVAYFLCALCAHVRLRDRGIGGAVGFLVLAAAALIVGLTYHNYW